MIDEVHAFSQFNRVHSRKGCYNLLYHIYEQWCKATFSIKSCLIGKERQDNIIQIIPKYFAQCLVAFIYNYSIYYDFEIAEFSCSLLVHGYMVSSVH